MRDNVVAELIDKAKGHGFEIDNLLYTEQGPQCEYNLGFTDDYLS